MPLPSPSSSDQTNIGVPMKTPTMKTQNTLLSSSSSYKENNKHNHNNNSNASSHHLTPKTIGCMSGIFHFVSRYQNRRKYLTSGKKHEKTVTSSSSSPAPSKSKPSMTTATTTTNAPDSLNEPNNQRTSCHVILRSPTLPPEIRRRSDSFPPLEKENNNHLRSSLPPPTLVARLMGLGSPEHVDSATETRRKLLGQLEKCDRDLKALKKIIDTVRSSEEKRSLVVPPPVKGEDDAGGGAGGEEESKESSKSSSVISSEQVPSPVSVLDELVTRSPTIARRKHCDEKLVHQQRKKPGEEDSYSTCLFDRINSDESTPAKSEDLKMASPTWVKKAMKESVEQVCKDIAWGQRREVGRIGLALQDHICRDLIEETITEIGSFSSCKHLPVSSLPFEACKRRLQF